MECQNILISPTNTATKSPNFFRPNFDIFFQKLTLNDKNDLSIQKIFWVKISSLSWKWKIVIKIPEAYLPTALHRLLRHQEKINEWKNRRNAGTYFFHEAFMKFKWTFPIQNLCHLWMTWAVENMRTADPGISANSSFTHSFIVGTIYILWDFIRIKIGRLGRCGN